MLNLVKGFDLLRGHRCQRMLTRTGKDIAFSGASSGVGDLKISLGSFSNKITALDKAIQLGVSLDDSQYLLCTMISKMKDEDPLKDELLKLRLQIVIGIDQLRSMLLQIREVPSEDVHKSLARWIKTMDQLYNQSTLEQKRLARTQEYQMPELSPPPPSPISVTAYYATLHANAKSTLAQIEFIHRSVSRNLPLKGLYDDLRYCKYKSEPWLERYIFVEDPKEYDDRAKSVSVLCRSILQYFEKATVQSTDEEFQTIIYLIRTSLEQLIGISSAELYKLGIYL